MPFLRSLHDGSLEVMPDCMMPLHGECVVEVIATDLDGFRRADSHRWFEVLNITTEGVAATITAVFATALT